MANFFKEEIDQAGERIECAIEKAAEKIGTQRAMATDDLKLLIDYAAIQLADLVDKRIDKAVQGIRNTSVAIGAAILLVWLGLTHADKLQTFLR